MYVGWPQGIESFIAKSGSGHVVHESVKPDIGHVTFIKWQRNTPLQPLSRSGDAKVVNWFLQELQHLIAAKFRLYEIVILREEID